MLADLFFVFAMGLFGIRLAQQDTYGTHWVVADVFSALFMVLAMYFYLFAPTTSTSVYAANSMLLYTTTAVTAVPVNSNGFVLLVTASIMYVVLMFIMALRDFILRRGAFQN